jgi:hypothetical protein
MSGNGAQGTKFRISVCTNDTLSNNKRSNRNIQLNIEQSIRAYKLIVKNEHSKNKVIKHNIKSGSCNSYKNIVNADNIKLKEITPFSCNKEQIINKQKTRGNLLKQLKYIKLMKSNDSKKSYNSRKMGKLIKLCEVINEDKLQEYKFCTTSTKQVNRNMRKNFCSNIILKDIISNKKVNSDVKLTPDIMRKNHKVDNSSSYFSTMKLVS